jgi:hypothetical protein
MEFITGNIKRAPPADKMLLLPSASIGRMSSVLTDKGIDSEVFENQSAIPVNPAYCYRHDSGGGLFCGW